MKRLRFLQGMALALCAAATSASLAQAWPAKPIRLIVPFPAAGATDLFARTLAQKMGERLGASLVIDNKPGAGGAIGSDLAAKAPPDGYTLLLATTSTHSIGPSLGKLPYDAVHDFTPISHVGDAPSIMVVPNTAPANSVKEWIAYARKNPGKLNYGSTGSGSSNHLSMELFMKMTGVKLAHIPYKGSAPAVTAILGGEIDALFDNVPNVLQQIKAGKMKAIGVSGLQRAVLLPEVPTISESGVPGYEVNVWFGMQVAAATPRPIVDKLNRDIVTLLKEPDVVKRFRDQGVEVVASTPEQFSKLVQSEVLKWTQLVQDANIRIE